jgi:hypothetical protein
MLPSIGDRLYGLHCPGSEAGDLVHSAVELCRNAGRARLGDRAARYGGHCFGTACAAMPALAMELPSIDEPLSRVFFLSEGQ